MLEKYELCTSFKYEIYVNQEKEQKINESEISILNCQSIHLENSISTLKVGLQFLMIRIPDSTFCTFHGKNVAKLQKFNLTIFLKF